MKTAMREAFEAIDVKGMNAKQLKFVQRILQIMRRQDTRAKSR